MSQVGAPWRLEREIGQRDDRLVANAERPHAERGEGRQRSTARLVDGRYLIARTAPGDECRHRRRRVVDADRIAKRHLEAAICPDTTTPPSGATKRRLSVASWYGTSAPEPRLRIVSSACSATDVAVEFARMSRIDVDIDPLCDDLSVEPVNTRGDVFR